MKRDMDLIRLLLLQVETGEEPAALGAYHPLLVAHNVALMVDAGLLDATIIPGTNGVPCAASIIRLTWAGHDFLDSIRDEGLWTKAKTNVLRPAASWSFAALKKWLELEIASRLGHL